MEHLVDIFNQHVLKSDFSLIVLIISFLGGVVASLSPCSLGILPIVLAYVSGTQHKTLTTFFHMLIFVLGISFTMTIVGLICAFTGAVFTAFAPTYWILILTSLILIFGLNLIGVIEINYPSFIKELPKSNNKNALIFPFILGMVFALTSTPCSTPILAAIMAAATLSANYLMAAFMLLLFALGQGVIIIIAGLFTSFFKNISKIASYTENLTKFSGIVLILFALYIYYKIFSSLF